MGTTYKGDTKYYRSIGQNVLITSQSYNFHNGYFGQNSIHGNNSTRNIVSEDNMKTAIDFYNKIALGGKEQTIDSNLKITRMADGTTITMRKISHSDGTPVVDINIKRSTHTGGIKDQKIHFVLEGE
ncbi:MAG: hypothetical protein LUF32_03140 [Clostridiales bacterium]|nr:hypothetical protein [Clostridiales bacterium]